MPVATLKVIEPQRGRTHVSQPGLGGFMRMTQGVTATCRRLSATDAGLVMVMEGRKVIHQQGSEIVVPAGSTVMLPSGNEFDITNEVGKSGHYQALAIYFDATILPTIAAPETVAVHTVKTLAPTSSGLVRAMEMAVSAIEDQALPKQIASHRLSELLLWVQAEGFTLVRPRSQDLLIELRKLLGSDPSAKWSTNELARTLAVSEATLRRKLAKAGTTLTDVAIDVRMTSALAMLQTSDENITNIAMAVGYDSPSRFSLRFRDRFGLSPSEFRRN
jgi:AraC-like DNA-binding protein